MTQPDRHVSILFVCMGNICRSPLAEGLFAHRAAERGVGHLFEVESAGTGGWHVGEEPDPRARAIAARHGIELRSRARQVHRDDWRRFDLLVCMDEDNRRHLERMGAPADKLRMMLAFDPGAPVRDVPDPYYGAGDGFERVFALLDSACAALLDDLLAPGR